MEEKERYQELTVKVNRLYKGFDAMDIRKCVIQMCETQFLDMTFKDLIERRRDSTLLDIWDLNDEKMYAEDIRWDMKQNRGDRRGS